MEFDYFANTMKVVWRLEAPSERERARLREMIRYHRGHWYSDIEGILLERCAGRYVTLCEERYGPEVTWTTGP